MVALLHARQQLRLDEARHNVSSAISTGISLAIRRRAILRPGGKPPPISSSLLAEDPVAAKSAAHPYRVGMPICAED